MLEIVFEDSHLLVINKPPGVLSQPGKQMDGSIATQVAEQYPDATGPLLVHRLDMDTSGLIMLAKNRSTHRALQQLFEKRKIAKSYIAVLRSKPAGIGGLIDLPLRADIEDRPRQIVCFDHGKKSRTMWQVLEHTGGVTRVLFTPVTGRTHQLRVHAASVLGLACPIVGDRLYGNESDRMLLHANSLKFIHPVTQKALQLRSDPAF